MVHLTGAGKGFGAKVLFGDLNWVINAEDRVGLVGANGSGKSTLLKMLAGVEPLDAGSISAAKNLTTGYLPQDGISLSGRTVLQECISAFGPLLEIEKEMETLTHRMAEVAPNSEEYHQVADRYDRISTEFLRCDGYTLEAQTSAVLSGLGFSTEDANRPTEEFSGGWQMRIALAKLLLTKPNLLLLDEPTNHLDLEARNWLEQFLREYPGAVVLVSHDRYFLDVTINRILELWNKRAYFYPGNYEKYLKQKEDRRTQLEAAYKNQKDRIDQIEAFINRFRYQATKARQVQSRIKELDKIERVEIPPDEKTIHFSFPQPPQSGRIVAEFQGVSKSYGEKRVFGNVSFIVNRGDRIALVGVNGAGKSTLIKIFAGAEAPSGGEFRLGHNVKVDYFAQDQYKALDPNARLLDDLTSVAPTNLSDQTRLRSLLGCFLFSDDEVFKRIGVLSGGERNRYALARMLLVPPNFLLLDEPTNHLDLRAKDVLLEALQKYTGTVVFVSHDRYFIDKLATRVFEIEHGMLQDYPGNYEDYLWQKEHGEATAAIASSNGNVRQSHEVASTEKRSDPQQQQPQPQKKVNPSIVRKMERRRKELEEEIARCETEIISCETELASFKSAEDSIRLTKLLDDRRAQLKEKMAEWEQTSLSLENA